jgi:hypothetical protein
MSSRKPFGLDPKKYLALAFAVQGVGAAFLDDHFGQLLSMMGTLSSGKLLTAEQGPSQCHGVVVHVVSSMLDRLMNWLRHLEKTTVPRQVTLEGCAANSTRRLSQVQEPLPPAACDGWSWQWQHLMSRHQQCHMSSEHIVTVK